MKIFLPLAMLAAFLFAACEDEPPVRPIRTRQQPARYPAAPPPEYPPDEQPFNPGGAPPTTPPAPGDTVPQDNNPPSQTPMTAAPAKTSKGDIPYGIPVPNKPGFVTSPYAPNQGYVDVRGFPPGTEVKDPYTNKIFLVP